MLSCSFKWQSARTTGLGKEAVTCTVMRTWKLHPSDRRSQGRASTGHCTRKSRCSAHIVCCFRGVLFPLFLAYRVLLQHGAEYCTILGANIVYLTPVAYVALYTMTASTQHETNANVGYCAKSPIQAPVTMHQEKLESALLSSALSYLTYLPLPLSISRYLS